MEVSAIATTTAPILPTAEERRSLDIVRRFLRDVRPEGEAYLVGPAGERTAIPHALYDVLLQAVQQLARGRGVSVVPAHEELTTQQAADLLGISRPSLVKLLDEGALAHRMVGTHRRVALRDVLTYREQRSVRRKAALGELAREADALGLYD